MSEVKDDLHLVCPVQNFDSVMSLLYLLTLYDGVGNFFNQSVICTRVFLLWSGSVKELSVLRRCE